jgi:hypothetical protein
MCSRRRLPAGGHGKPPPRPAGQSGSYGRLRRSPGARGALPRSRYSGDSVARTDGLGIDTDVPSQSSSASR